MVGVRMNIALWNLNFVNKYSDGLGRSTKPALTPSPSIAVESFSLSCRKRATASVTDTFTNVSPKAAIIIIANLKMFSSKGFGMYCMLVVGLGWEGLCRTSIY